MPPLPRTAILKNEVGQNLALGVGQYFALISKWSHTGLRPGRKTSHNRYIRSFVSHLPQIRTCTFAHTAPHIMRARLRTAPSVNQRLRLRTRRRDRCCFVYTVMGFRCTRHVPLQRCHDMASPSPPPQGPFGMVPLARRYYETLRLPTAHFAALRFLRLAIPSLRPWFVPPGPGRGAVDQSGVGRRYLQPPGSMEEAGSPKFPEVPL